MRCSFLSRAVFLWGFFLLIRCSYILTLIYFLSLKHMGPSPCKQPFTRRVLSKLIYKQVFTRAPGAFSRRNGRKTVSVPPKRAFTCGADSFQLFSGYISASRNVIFFANRRFPTLDNDNKSNAHHAQINNYTPTGNKTQRAQLRHIETTAKDKRNGSRERPPYIEFLYLEEPLLFWA